MEIENKQVNVTFTEEDLVVNLGGEDKPYVEHVDLDEISLLISRFPDDPALFIETFLERSLSAKQKVFIDSTKVHKHVVAIWSRQTGKSTVIASYIVWRLLFGKGCDVNGEHIDENIVVVAPIKDQVDNIYAKIDVLINRSDYIEQFIKKRNSLKIVAKNGNRVTFISASPGSHIRGATATCIVIDETQDVLDSKYYADILPFGSTTNALIIEAGTPKIKNHFYRTIIAKDIKVVKQMYFECPFLSEEFIAKQKANMPESLFRQEYMCEFIEEGVLAFPSRLFEKNVDGSSPYFGSWNLEEYDYIKTIEEITETVRVKYLEASAKGAVYVAGEDLGRQNDHTVLSVFRTDTRPIRLELQIIFPLGLDYIEIAEKTAFVYNIFKPHEFNVDYSSEKSFVDILRSKGVPVILAEEKRKTGGFRKKNITGALAFTQRMKTEMVNNARVLLEKYELQLPVTAELLLSQFMNQQFEYNELTKKYKYYHPSNEHDDALWSSLLAIKNVKGEIGDERAKFVNPWAKYDEEVHNKNQKDVVSVQSNYNRRRDSYSPSEFRRGHSKIFSSSRIKYEMHDISIACS